MKFAARWIEQRLVKQRVAISRNDHILAFGEVFETSLTFWDSINSLSIHFAILLTLVTLGQPSQKHLLRLLTDAHEAYTVNTYI